MAYTGMGISLLTKGILAGDAADVTHFVVQCPLTMEIETTQLSLSLETPHPVGIDFLDTSQIECVVASKEVTIEAEKPEAVVIAPDHIVEVLGRILVEDDDFVKEKFWGNDITTEFELTYYPKEDSVFVFYDGVQQREGEDYVVDDKTIRFDFIAETGSIVDIQYYKRSDIFEKETFSGNGVDSDFTLTFTPQDDSVLVFLDGVQQQEGTSWTRNDKIISLTFIPTSLEKIDVQYVKEQE